MIRSFWKCDTLDAVRTDEEGGSFEERFEETGRYAPVVEADANLVGSRLLGSDVHAFVVDLDVPARLVPSTTPGHSHLYIDLPISWEKYKAILVALADAGILEDGYVRASLRRGQTFVRKPGVVKPPDAPSSRRLR